MIKRIKKFLEYLLFIAFIITFLFVLLVFDIIQRLAVPFGIKAVDRSIYLFNYWILQALKIVGCKLEVSGVKELPSEGPAIIISNHQSMFDIPSIHYALKPLRPRFVSKKELGKGIPGVSTTLKVSKAALIDRSNATQAIAEINKFGDFLKKEKVSGVIFPEGTRARDGELKAFKKRGIEQLVKATAPCWIVPVTIDGSWKLQNRKFGPIPLGIRIKLNIGKPFFVTMEDLNSSHDISKLGHKLHHMISNTLEQLRN